ncbi:PTS ascorbate transporter subunit IIC [Thermoactinomyces vulgaris]|uniref:PTS ascorbate transporter subunit IIC n=2 Tax=Thermoactinomycetaceae TaxID=186824 RepID=UPI000A4320D2|nr:MULTISPECIES: PTS ascorbate transporter subunit IIC [Thermoactinomyces]MBH8583450.1 PTS ascorbate transporter subunit IIC [Thermoactinomyces sp. CICC 10735]MBI0387353.1 PTS ascorbate transporter subunit IIC [Thermoactinomyces sp. CICC 24227]MCF6135456.1 PTS ascorbate transporter subunit IIC [Thermoactinomyces vulgaris]QBK13219.1 PTS ascorbate transporter subunit IIC [Thermoactinomyces vulgaris]QCV54589.1 PTS ascorbate transporter subunit IIC [Thermoactinomyces vulgaris]
MKMELLNVFLDILATPAILVGVFALIGLLLQKKEVSQVISGTLKTVLGFILITAGGNVIISSLDVFGQMFNRAFSISGVIPNNEAIVAVAQSTFGTQTALIMVFGMVVNLILARFTPLKFVFLTGHHTLFMACLIAVILSTAGLNGALLVIVGSVILGILMVVSPAILFPYVRKITGSDDFAVGHFGSVGYLVAGAVGKWTGDKSKSTESIKVPKQLGFLRDTSVAVSLTMAILFIVVALFTGSGYIESQLSDGQNYLVYSLIQAITFAAGVYVVLAGVRMLIGEIVPAFKGFAEKLVPDAKPALDCPTVFPFAPNAVIIGFLSSFVAGLVSMFVLPLFGLRVIVPGLVPHFFTGATAGVFGNATGGRRGAILGAFANGLIISFLPALLLPALGDLGFRETTFGDADFGVVGLILSFLADFFS